MSGIRLKMNIENIVLFTFGLTCLLNLVDAEIKGLYLPVGFYLSCVAWIILRLAQLLNWFKITEALFTVLILATFNIIPLSPLFQTHFQFGISAITFPKFYILPFLMTLCLLISKRKEIKTFWLKIQGRSPEQKAQQRLSSQEQFKQKFQNLSEEQLMAKLDQNLQPGAQDAIHELLKEKKEG
ncbi:hypothetical protein [Croceimicrobium hydrocarbonivorans]|uniref:Uncharacterized protein n=1 Tax=Croceimicrobium hydrocarbonivorans TaxID=2761580 RepID=A0A7H0VFB2_9FLAO|nr:hypothetical protein [Croceimicrobium hydrocarbonivorans]QNR24410.1 hypothetical protein H4K34_00805 [Croceimicrobium hydrocarbonivorans]